MIVLPDGRRDITTRVFWLQGISLFADLRQPADLPTFPLIRGLADLTHQDCAYLARQEGFAGHFGASGACFEWHRTIDFQPVSPHADAGSLSWEAGILVERGRDFDYVEHWHREATHPPAAAALALRDADDGVDGLLLRAGDDFMFARGRTATLHGAVSLGAAVADADLDGARALIDCEISRGLVEAGGFVIASSTLPHRVGDRLGQRLHTGTLYTQDRRPDGSPYTRRWSIVESEGDIGALEDRHLPQD
jgi:hypothetical protein